MILIDDEMIMDLDKIEVIQRHECHCIRFYSQNRHHTMHFLSESERELALSQLKDLYERERTCIKL